jgi:hypothetical protein
MDIPGALTTPRRTRGKISIHSPVSIERCAPLPRDSRRNQDDDEAGEDVDEN